MNMKTRLNNRMKQIISWPFLILGIYLMLRAIAINSSDYQVLICFVLIMPGLLLRNDLLEKENLKEFDLKYRFYFTVGAAISLIFSIGFLIFVLVNLGTILIKNYSPYIAIGFGVALAYFGIPCEIWLYKKYRSI
jgi:hypothetical protein